MHNQYHDQEPRRYPNEPATQRHQPGSGRHNLSYDMGRDEYDRPISAHAPPHAQSLPSYDQGERYQPHQHGSQQHDNHHPDAGYNQYREGPSHEEQHANQNNQTQLHARDNHRRPQQQGGGGSQQQQQQPGHQQHGREDYQNRSHPGHPMGGQHPYGGYDRNEPHSTNYNPGYRPDYERGRNPSNAGVNQPRHGPDHHTPHQAHYHAAINRQPGYAGNFEAQQGQLSNEHHPPHPRHEFGPPRHNQDHHERDQYQHPFDQHGQSNQRRHFDQEHQQRYGQLPHQGGYQQQQSWEQARHGQDQHADHPGQYRAQDHHSS